MLQICQHDKSSTLALNCYSKHYHKKGIMQSTQDVSIVTDRGLTCDLAKLQSSKSKTYPPTHRAKAAARTPRIPAAEVPILTLAAALDVCCEKEELVWVPSADSVESPSDVREEKY